MTILKVTDTLLDVLTKLSQGNPGALSVLCQILKEDQENGDGTLVFQLLKLDTLGIYGSLIWMLYKDTFRYNIRALMFALRHNRLEKVIKRKKLVSPSFADQWEYSETRYQAGEFTYS